MAVRARQKSGARIATVAVCVAFLVGGISTSAPAVAAPLRASAASSSPFVAIMGTGFRGYLLVQANGNVVARGRAHFYGSLPSEGIVPNAPIVAIVPAPPGVVGYWLVGADGGVYTFGHAPFYGSLGGTHLRHRVVALVPTATHKGYLLVDSTGALFGFGDARICCGSTYPAGPPRSAPIVAVNGQYEVASDGSVYTLGGTPGPYGSMAGRHLNAPIVGIEPLRGPCGLPRCDGYWLLASDGGVFSFGDARYLGSMGGRHLNQPVVGMSATYVPRYWLPGYWELAADGGVFSFGHATFFGSEADPART